ncbi:MAG: threonine/serine dehydratase [Rhizobiaceae bacterium]|nr:threonine/serine dehydratase [Rhizobiaceae bacterium]
MFTAPSLAEIEAASQALEGRIVATPTLTLNSDRITPYLPDNSKVHMKMELFQQAGSFKARGALLAADALTPEQRAAGVTAVSAGNHALAVSWSANQAGISAKVVMPDTADQIRVDGCRALGAEVVLVENVEAAFAEVDRLVKEEGRTMMHPFESPNMALGAATCGLEFIRSRPDMETIVLPIGGGGLIAGMASAIKLENPKCNIIGVEPFGADSMHKSFEKGEAVPIDKVNTIADSLGAPMALPSSYAITRANVDELVRIEDDEMRTMMKRLYEGLKIVAEPACAATTAAICGALRERLSGQNIGVIACGSNISLNKFNRLTAG